MSSLTPATTEPPPTRTTPPQAAARPAQDRRSEALFQGPSNFVGVTTEARPRLTRGPRLGGQRCRDDRRGCGGAVERHAQTGIAAGRGEARTLLDLGARYDEIIRRHEAAYVDKLDGRPSEERGVDIDKQWAREESQAKCRGDTIGENSRLQLDGVKASLELLKRAPKLPLGQSDAERARVFRVLVWYCSPSDGRLDLICRKSFDPIAGGLHSANWYPGQES